VTRILESASLSGHTCYSFPQGDSCGTMNDNLSQCLQGYLVKIRERFIRRVPGTSWPPKPTALGSTPRRRDAWFLDGDYGHIKCN